MLDYRIISLGTLSVHELWKRPLPARHAHATCVLVTSGDHKILIDPGLPPAMIATCLLERGGLEPDDIDDVFLTCFRPAHCRGISAFPNARWLIGERERETVGHLLVERFQEEKETDAQAFLREEIALLQKINTAPDQLADKVDLFPLPGFTPGTCGLLLSEPARTVLIAGDAVATREHLAQGRVLRNAFDVEAARESLREAIEIADVIIPGHDNLMINPLRRL